MVAVRKFIASTVCLETWDLFIDMDSYGTIPGQFTMPLFQAYR